MSTECGQPERDKRLLDICTDPDFIYYGPHKCQQCGAMICRVSIEQGGESFDYPETPIYPNTNWVLHDCPAKERMGAPIRIMMETFDEWWMRVGRALDPDTEEIAWVEKRKGLAEAAYEAARAQSCNYTCDDASFPGQVTFANGRRVTLIEREDTTKGYYLAIGKREE